MSDEEETQLERETRAFDRLALATIKALEASGLDMDGDLNGNVVKLGESYARLNAQVTELQAANTRLLEERRAVDIHYCVEHFYRVMDIPVLTEPQVPPEDRVRLRLRLIAEEFKELLASCLADSDDGDFVTLNRFLSAWPSVEAAIDKCVIDVDLLEFADACADLKYVIVGAELEFGIDGRPVFRAVHESNMKKVGGPVREDGKKLKPPDWKPPDIVGELRRQGFRG